MIHTIGDSHCWVPFNNVPNVTTHTVGPVTLKRAGHPKENLLIDAVAHIKPQPDDTLLFCFGEIDIRCWVHVHVTQRNKDPNILLQTWVTLYLDKIASLQHPKTAVMGVTPPAPKDRIDRQEFPVAGSDQERVTYTQLLNSLLKKGCQARSFAFVDLSPYADQDGMLPINLSDGTVHIGNNTLLLKALNNLDFSEREVLIKELPELLNGAGKTALYVGASVWRAFLLDDLIRWGWKTTVLEVWPTNVDCIRNTYNVPVIQGEVVTSPINQTFDLVLWWHGPEHVTKENLPRALNSLETHSSLIVLGCPENDSPQGLVYDNPFETHLWNVSQDDLRQLGYKTRSDPRPGNPNNIIAWKRILK